MEGIFFVKSIGKKENFTNKQGKQMEKVTMVISIPEVRTSDNGTYTADQDFYVSVIRDSLRDFDLQPRDWLTGSLSFSVNEGQNGNKFQDIRLNRFLKL